MLLTVVGLGNPGTEYAQTRHNLGFRVIDELAKRAGVKLKRQGKGREARAKIDDRNVLLIQPLTYMNLSGKAVQSALYRHEISIGNLLVISDDFNIPLGKLRLRKSGSAGGHNGIQSVIDCLGTEEFARLRIGIGPVSHGNDAVEFVLSSFTAEEEKVIQDIIPEAADSVLEWAYSAGKKQDGIKEE
ncbi:MAG: aminoacyl-tRNA hydrolase [Chloroflexi bacterium]|nr:aminoacyl-tRNA hydrolase [Chloroflexota bacterium]